jgi:putative phage-type endonuclease
MTTELIKPVNDDHWHEMRAADLTSTDMAALFGLSPYATKFEVWHRKRGTLVAPSFDNDRMRWGRRLESAIAHGIAEDRGWKVQPLKAYARDAEHRMGASFDFEIVGHPNGPGILEIKNVDGLAYRRGWSETEAPGHIEIQLQHQLTVMESRGYRWGAIAALVGGNQPVILGRQLDVEVAAALRAEAARFWASIAANDAPPPVLPEDAQMVIRLHQFSEPGTTVDLRDNEQAAALAAAYQAAGEAEKKAKADKDTARAALLELIGTREKALLNGYSVSAGMVGPAEVPAYTRQAYRNFRVTAKKAKE